MSSTLLKYSNKTVSYLPTRRGRRMRKLTRNFRRRVSRRTCKRALRSVVRRAIPFQNS